MAESAAHLVDHVLAPLPVRQWVVSLPKRLRYPFHHERKALNGALRIFLEEIERHLHAQSPGAAADSRTGAVAFIHRFGSSLNQHTHFHVCLIDGLFESDPLQGVRFIAAPALAAGDALTPLAPEAITTPPSASAKSQPADTPHRSAAPYLWAMLLARIYEAFPRSCPQCGSQMPILAFITEATPVQRILRQIGEPATPAPIAPARGPPPGEDEQSGLVFLDEERITGDPVAPPEPEYDFDQRVSWSAASGRLPGPLLSTR